MFSLCLNLLIKVKHGIRFSFKSRNIKQSVTDLQLLAVPTLAPFNLITKQTKYQSNAFIIFHDRLFFVQSGFESLFFFFAFLPISQHGQMKALAVWWPNRIRRMIFGRAPLDYEAKQAHLPKFDGK